MESPYKGKTGLSRVINAWIYSREGIKAAFIHEDAFRTEVFISIVLIPLTFYLGHNGIQRAMMIGSVILVLIVELLNSAIEAAVDRISIEHHLLAKRAKDMGSAAVFFALVNAVVVWWLLIAG